MKNGNRNSNTSNVAVAKNPLDPVLQNVYFPTRTNGMNPEPDAANSVCLPPGSYIKPNDYVFHQGRYSEGNTLREINGGLSYMKKECDANSNCSGFFYDGKSGQLKSGIQPERLWHTLLPKPQQGLYIKSKNGNGSGGNGIVNMISKQDFGEDRYVRNYDMYTGIESPGYSIKKVEMTDVRSLQQLCDSTPRCVGIGVTPKAESVVGDLKYRIQSRDRWVRDSRTDEDISGLGLYVTTSYPLEDTTKKGVFFSGENLSYCESNNLCKYIGNGKLATLDQVLAAQAGGFHSCKPGWIQETPSQGMSRPFPTRRAGYVGCDSKFGTSAYQSAPVNNGQKYGAYCYGDIPPERIWS